MLIIKLDYLTCSDLQILMNIFSPLSVLVFKQNPEQEKHITGHIKILYLSDVTSIMKYHNRLL